MKKRIPFDVQFLLESILSEDPDTMEIDDVEAERLNAKGANIIPDNYDWEHNADAVPFWIDKKNGIVVFSKLGTHGRMDNSLSSAARAVADPVIFDGDFKEKSNMGCVGMFVRDTSMTLYFFGGGINTFDDIKKYLKENRKRLRDLVIRSGYELCGRAWIESNAVSFWNTKAEIDPVMKLMLDFMKKIKMDPTKCGYEFADSQRLYGYTDLSGNVEEKDKLSPEELHALQAKKHLKKSKQDYGPEYWEKHGEKAAKGFDIPAKAAAAIPALEEIIRLKNLVKEGPDNITISKEDKEKFDKLDIPLKVGVTYHSDQDARAFFLAKDNVIICSGKSTTHGSMENTLIGAAYNSKTPDLFASNFGFFNNRIGVGFKSRITEEILYFYGLQANKLEDIRKYLFNHSSYFRNLEIRGTSNEKQSLELSGRIWLSKNVISFWNDKDECKKHIKEISSFIQSLGIDPKKIAYQFIDSGDFLSYDEFTGKEPDRRREKLTPEEMHALQIKKHLEKNKDDYDMDYWHKHGEKNAGGFDIPAKAAAAIPALEGHIKLKDILKENPDTVVSTDKKHLARYYDEDAVAFFAFPQFSIFNVAGVHSKMIEVMGYIYKEVKRSTKLPDETALDIIENNELEVSDVYGLLDALSSGPLSKFYENLNKKMTPDDTTGIQGGGYRVAPGGLAGRLWMDKKIISFWRKKEDVINRWAEVEKMFKDMPKAFGSLADYKIDWLEREADRKIPLTSASDISSSSTKEEKLSLLSKLFGGKTLTDEEIAKLQAKLHVMDPKEKKKFMMAMGYKNKKASDIADALGMTVAEFNHIMNVNEGRVKLKDLLKENPDFVSDEYGGKIAKYFDGDAIAFFAFPEFSIINRGGVHYDMINVMSDVRDDLFSYSENESEVEYLMKEKGFTVSNISKMLDALDRGPLHDFLKHAQWKDGERSDDSSDGSAATLGTGGFRIKSGGLAGRVWTKKKIISFWNTKEDVVKRWNEIEKMFNDLRGTLGDLGEYRVDWLERDASLKTPLTPASEVTSAGSSGDGQQTFLDKLFGEKKLSDEEIKKLQGRLHTMNAKEKKEVMMAMGYSNTKATDIANKLGMTVAQFNHIMNVNESDQ